LEFEQNFQPHINDFPPEILVRIFSFVSSDDCALLNTELTCSRWKTELEKDRIYVRKCRKVLSNNPQLLPTFEQHQFEQKIQSDFSSSKKFYFKLQNLNSRWRYKPKLTVIDCLKAEVNEKKMKISDDWLASHNYTG